VLSHKRLQLAKINVRDVMVTLILEKELIKNKVVKVTKIQCRNKLSAMILAWYYKKKGYEIEEIDE